MTISRTIKAADHRAFWATLPESTLGAMKRIGKTFPRARESEMIAKSLRVKVNNKTIIMNLSLNLEKGLSAVIPELARPRL